MTFANTILVPLESSTISNIYLKSMDMFSTWENLIVQLYKENEE